jgi:hypothetical protein
MVFFTLTVKDYFGGRVLLNNVKSKDSDKPSKREDVSMMSVVSILFLYILELTHSLILDS